MHRSWISKAFVYFPKATNIRPSLTASAQGIERRTT